ncbi:hypothetical protein BRYFOR_06804 [Marvinbryantia formatexigens DSM 14469]|uniref:Uncharacterized protein n=1 Tax=Marvinbryantia formatexigens DSM 14469 TaxID=478749 RepID=C6LDV5_9FIRM|nr:hypothetical protein BRYFOR_06804 [Marvinbryantia formatexigens DSM 14469]
MDVFSYTIAVYVVPIVISYFYTVTWEQSEAIQKRRRIFIDVMAAAYLFWNRNRYEEE